jgi:transposase
MFVEGSEGDNERGRIERRHLEELIGAGLSIAAIANTLCLSKSSVRHWLGKYGLRTKNPPRRRSTPEAIAARDAGVAKLTQVCPRHGETAFVLEGSGYFRCRRCRVESVVKHRRKLKDILIAEAGGACAVCGYRRTRRALEFHHLDPNQKRFTLSAKGVTLALETLRLEASKCVLLCSNCHAEVEDGLIVLPVESAS